MEQLRRTIPFGPLRHDVSDYDAPEGILRVCENLRPVGPQESPYLAPVAPSTNKLEIAEDVVAIGRQTTDDTTKLVVVTTQRILLIDPGDDFSVTELYTTAPTNTMGAAQFAAVGPRVFIAVSDYVQPANAAPPPYRFFVLEGTTLVPYEQPYLPRVDYTFTEVPAGQGLLPEKCYGLRLAYVFYDGSIGPPSPPLWINTAAGTAWRMDLTRTTTYQTANNALLSKIVAGIGVFLTVSTDRSIITGAADMFVRGLPFYRVATLPTPHAGTDALSIAFSDAQIIAGEQLADDTLSAHHIRAGACYAYNQRLFLGDVQYDFAQPDLANLCYAPPVYTRANASDYAWKLRVAIKTSRGTYVRYSPVMYVLQANANDVRMRAEDPTFQYPDRRAYEFQVLVDPNNSGTFRLHSTYTARPAEAYNIAYADVAPMNLTTALTDPQADPSTTYDRDTNRIVYSETLQPWNLPASNTFYSSKSDSDAVMRFETNTRPASDAQYGYAPLLVLGRETIQALELGEDGRFVQALPLARRGCAGRQASCNANGLIFFASDDGIWTLSPQQSDLPVSWPLQAYVAFPTDLLNSLSPTTAMAFVTDANGKGELWVAVSGHVYVYAMYYDRWYTIVRTRPALCPVGDLLYSYDPDANQLTEELSGTAAVPFYLVCGPLGLDRPGAYKRLRKLWIRHAGIASLEYKLYSTDPVAGRALVAEGTLLSTGADAIQVPVGVVLDLFLVLSGTADYKGYIQQVGVDFEHRLEHRAPGVVPVTVDAWQRVSGGWGGLTKANETADSVDLTASGPAKFIINEVTVTLLGVNHTITSVKVGPSLLAAERVVKTGETTAKIITDN